MDRDWAISGIGVISQTQKRRKTKSRCAGCEASKHINLRHLTTASCRHDGHAPAGWRWGYKSTTNPTRRVYNKKTTPSKAIGGGAIMPFNYVPEPT